MKAAKEKAEEQYEVASEKGKSSRETMLQAIRKNQPEIVELPFIPNFAPYFDDTIEKFISVLTGIGGQVYRADDYTDVAEQIQKDFAGVNRIVSFDKRVSSIAEIQDGTKTLHNFEDVDVCIVHSNLAVAESGAVWITDKDMPERVLPFISQSLVVVVNATDIVPTLHDAYAKIGDAEYGFATFIAGPSKTADIEQSLVLGAHGPKNMTLFILE